MKGCARVESAGVDFLNVVGEGDVLQIRAVFKGPCTYRFESMREFNLLYQSTSVKSGFTDGGD